MLDPVHTALALAGLELYHTWLLCRASLGGVLYVAPIPASLGPILHIEPALECLGSTMCIVGSRPVGTGTTCCICAEVASADATWGTHPRVAGDTVCSAGVHWGAACSARPRLSALGQVTTHHMLCMGPLWAGSLIPQCLRSLLALFFYYSIMFSNFLFSFI